MKCVDPASMCTAERLAELGELLAAGVQRFLARERKAIPWAENSRDQLDVLPDSEAPCASNSKEAQ